MFIKKEKLCLEHICFIKLNQTLWRRLARATCDFPALSTTMSTRHVWQQVCHPSTISRPQPEVWRVQLQERNPQVRQDKMCKSFGNCRIARQVIEIKQQFIQRTRLCFLHLELDIFLKFEWHLDQSHTTHDGQMATDPGYGAIYVPTSAPQWRTGSLKNWLWVWCCPI